MEVIYEWGYISNSTVIGITVAFKLVQIPKVYAVIRNKPNVRVKRA